MRLDLTTLGRKEGRSLLPQLGVTNLTSRIWLGWRVTGFEPWIWSLVQSKDRKPPAVSTRHSLGPGPAGPLARPVGGGGGRRGRGARRQLAAPPPGHCQWPCRSVSSRSRRPRRQSVPRATHRVRDMCSDHTHLSQVADEQPPGYCLEPPGRAYSALHTT